MRRAWARGGSVSGGAMFAMLVLNFLKCDTYQRFTFGWGFGPMVVCPPVRQRSPMRTNEWSEIGMRITL